MPAWFIYLSYIMTAVSTAYSIYAQRKMADYQQRVAERNARFAELQAADALKRGEVEAKNYKSKVKQLTSQQKAVLAANGIDLGSESAVNVLETTNQVGERDVLQIKNNAAKEAWQFRVQAGNQRSRGMLARMKGEYGQVSSLLSGANSVASKWQKFHS